MGGRLAEEGCSTWSQGAAEGTVPMEASAAGGGGPRCPQA